MQIAERQNEVRKKTEEEEEECSCSSSWCWHHTFCFKTSFNSTFNSLSIQSLLYINTSQRGRSRTQEGWKVRKSRDEAEFTTEGSSKTGHFQHVVSSWWGISVGARMKSEPRLFKYRSRLMTCLYVPALAGIWSLHHTHYIRLLTVYMLLLHMIDLTLTELIIRITQEGPLRAWETPN